jgi:predicted aspartyl protease
MHQRDFALTRRVCHELVTLTAVLFSLAAQAPEAMATTFLRDQLRRHGYEQIELRRSGENRLFLFGRLDGRKHSLLVDTGWSFTTVSTNAAERLKSQRELGLQAGNPFPGTNMHSAGVLLNSLRLGRVAFTNQPACRYGFQWSAGPFDVVLGCDF